MVGWRSSATWMASYWSAQSVASATGRRCSTWTVVPSRAAFGHQTIKMLFSELPADIYWVSVD